MRVLPVTYSIKNRSTVGFCQNQSSGKPVESEEFKAQKKAIFNIVKPIFLTSLTILCMIMSYKNHLLKKNAASSLPPPGMNI